MMNCGRRTHSVKLLHQANIRFGRENNLEDDSHNVSWKYGLEKIILGLQKWFVKNSLLGYEGNLDHVREKWIREGLLPLKNMGRLTLETIEEEIKPICSTFKEFTNGAKPENIPVSLEAEK
jgi:exonuclease V gamma subunit